MFTKLLTVSAFTLVLASGALAQTSGGSDSSGGTGGASSGESSSDTGTSDGSSGSSANGSGTGSSTTGGTSRGDDDRCTESSAEKTTSTPSGTMPEVACPD